MDDTPRVETAPQPKRVTKLNLGSGGRKLEGFLNVDFCPDEKPDFLFDLGTQPWPWETDSIDEAVASHILEHLEGEQFFHFLRELYRVLKPRATCKIVIPHPRHRVFINDPTHYRAVTPDTLAMFSQRHYKAMLEKGGRLTPFWRYNRVDFDMVGPLQHALDPDLPKEWKDSGEWREKENYLNNIVVEWHFGITAVKPFIDECDV